MFVKGGCSFGSFFLRQENEHNHLTSYIIHYEPYHPSPLGETERSLTFLPPKQGDRGGLSSFSPRGDREGVFTPTDSSAYTAPSIPEVF